MPQHEALRRFGLPVLRPSNWSGGPNGGMGVDDEWHPTGGHTFSMELTRWPLLGERSFSPFIPEPMEKLPLQVRAKLSCSGRYGASLSVEVAWRWCGNLTNWKGQCSVASAKRRALAYLYDRHEEVVRNALATYYAGRISDRADVFSEQGEHLATFASATDAFNSSLLPRRFYASTRRPDGSVRATLCEHCGSTRSGSGGPEITKRLLELIEAFTTTKNQSSNQ